MIKIKAKLLVVFYILLVIVTGGVFMEQAIWQNPAYHDFADQGKLFFIPNFFNFITAIPLLLIGMFGIEDVVKKSTQNNKLIEQGEKNIFLILFSSIALLGFFLPIYYLLPNDYTLFLTRLAIIAIITSIYGLIIIDRIGVKMLKTAYYIIYFGLFTVIYWMIAELFHHGDLRLYISLQLFILLSLPFIIKWCKSNIDYNYPLHLGVVFLAMASYLEYKDHALYELSFHLISGYTLRNILLVCACYQFLHYFNERLVIKNYQITI